MRSYGHPPESLYKEPGGATLTTNWEAERVPRSERGEFLAL